MSIAESVGLAALGWVLSPVVKYLISKSTFYLGSDIATGLEDLETTLLPQFDLIIQAAQNSPHKDKLAKWLARLKNAYYDAEGILHDVEYEHLKAEANTQKKKILTRISSHPVIKPLAKLTSKLSLEKRELWYRLTKLKEIAAEAKTFHDLLKLPAAEENNTKGSGSPVTISLLTHEVFGRDGDRDDIISFLFDEQGEISLKRGHSVVAITGIGGAGKTTLAQYVYNNELVKEHYDSRMWLCLSQNNDVKKLTIEMIESITEVHTDLSSLNVLQNKLMRGLQESKKGVLLVLDDVWYDVKAGEKQWDDLLAPFACIEGRCKILITSRSTSFPIALQPHKLIKLSDLEPNDFISLFRYYAMGDLETNNPLRKDLSDIGDQIAEKLCKSPMAAKVVGTQLRKQPTKKFWQATLQNVNLTSISKILLWSYQCMDVQLQRCFLFCGVFPKNTWCTGYDLVQYWVALDLIQSWGDSISTNAEDIGSEYFQMMVENSIFQLINGKYFMHDLFFDLAENLSAGDCFRVTNVQTEIPPTTLHLFLRVNTEMLKENISSISNLRNLRSLIVYIPFNTDNEVTEFLSIVTSSLKNLRILDIWSGGYRTLSSVVGDLRNLRYLNVWQSSIEMLPDSVSRLYHLQFLMLPMSIKTLPTKLSNLKRLQSIGKYDKDFNRVNSLPRVPYLGKLTSLQHLDEFHVSMEEGYDLRQLGSLSKIGGTLKIVNLENVKHRDEAVDAKLVNKKNLERLELVWGGSNENVSDLEVIEALKAPSNLEVLSIDGYRNTRFPNWLDKDSQLVLNLISLQLINCNAITVLPPNLYQSGHCRRLILKNIGAFKELLDLPECICELKISRCHSLIFVCENELQKNNYLGTLATEIWRTIMIDRLTQRQLANYVQVLVHGEVKIFQQTCLEQNCSEELRIIEAAAQDNVADRWENVMRSWWHCHQQRMNFIFSTSRENRLKLPSKLCSLKLGYCCISDGALSECLRGMEALEELCLKGVMTITTLPPKEVMQSMKSLRVLKIKHCWCLKSLGGLHALAKLEKLSVQFCWCLEMEYECPDLLPPTLQFFVMRNCVVPQGIFMGNLQCLKSVEIGTCDVPRTLSFSHLIPLKSLMLLNCHKLFSIEGFDSRSSLALASLVGLPNLDVQSVLKSCKGSQVLNISSLVMLNKLLSSAEFAPPQTLNIYCQHDVVSFEISDSLRSIQNLGFVLCDTREMPATLRDFSTLESIKFYNCPNLSKLPELPPSVNYFEVINCPALRESCQPSGSDWDKIHWIQHRRIE